MVGARLRHAREVVLPLHLDRAVPEHAPRAERGLQVLEQRLGFGCIAASERETPTMLANLV
jgi:hypothetical protein